MEQLFDGFSRRIDYLRLSITDRCNLRCTYCAPPRRTNSLEPAGLLSYEEVRAFTAAAVFAGISKVRVTGGEPLVRQDVVSLIEMLSELDGLDDIGMTTNGILLEEFAEELKRAGLSRINVSIDTLDPVAYETLTKCDSLDKALAGLRKALDVGLHPVKVNAVLTRGVNDDPADFVRLTYDYPVHVRFIERMPFSGQMATNADFVSADEQLTKLSAYGELESDVGPMGAGPATYMKFKGALGTVGFISPISRHFCGECNRLRLTPDGKLRTCLFSDEEFDVRPAIAQGEEAIRQLIAVALDKKPRERALGQLQTKRGMFQIGG